MLRIGEFSCLSRVTVKALRFYDDAGLLKPAYVDRFTNYRYYALDQLPRLHRILAFKYLGFTLEQIVTLLDEDVPAERIHGMVLLKQADLQSEVQEKQALLERVEARLRLIERGATALTHDVIITSVPRQTVLSSRRIVPTVADMERLSQRVYLLLREHGIRASGPLIHVYHHRGYREDNLDVEVGVPIEERVPALVLEGEQGFVRELPAIPLAATLVIGVSDKVPEAYTAIGRWIYSNSYTITGRCREVRHGTEASGGNSTSRVIEIQYPVSQAGGTPTDSDEEDIEE